MEALFFTHSGPQAGTQSTMHTIGTELLQLPGTTSVKQTILTAVVYTEMDGLVPPVFSEEEREKVWE